MKNGTYPKVGSYDANNPTNSDLLNSYPSLQKGDAVVSSSQSHTFIIALNFSDFVHAYEQTPYMATLTVWTYDQLANKKHMPFTKNEKRIA